MSMTRAKIEASIAEAQRFLVAASHALERLDYEVEESNSWWTRDGSDARKSGPGDHSFGSAATGTLRRRSMDLTRSLAELRRP